MGFIKSVGIVLPHSECARQTFFVIIQGKAMNIERALSEFERLKKRKFVGADRERILAVATELNLNRFTIVSRESGTVPVYIKDDLDILHVHSTMLVSREKFRSSIHRGLDPYEFHQYFYALSRYNR